MSGSADGKMLVLGAVDLVQLIAQSVKLVRRGNRFVGLCPFHQEKSPSFSVSAEKQLFYCFGCKAAGNAIDFVMRRDRVEFRDALESLARYANVELPRLSGGRGDPRTGQRQQLLDACSAAVGFFENTLRHPAQGAAAREYLAGRGFTDESLRRFSVGLAPDGWNGLLTALSRKFPVEVLLAAGLVKPRDGAAGQYDTFRRRIIFPIRDETGRTIAFGGRILPGDDSPAKYLNSPETPLFHKSRAVFGLDLAKQRIVETRTVAVVEGYTDVVMAHQHGATNVVSVLGTAMTELHVSLLRRFTDKIVLLFDADAAGENAVDRTVELFLTQPIEIAVATVPDGLDPDEFIARDGLDVFNALLANAVDALTFKWHRLRRQFDAAGDLTGQQKAVSAYLDVLAGARGAGPVDAIRWGAALSRVSKLTEIPVEQLQRRFAGSGRRGAAPRRQAVATDVAQVTEAASPTIRQGGPVLPLAQVLAERRILGCLMSKPEWWIGVQEHVNPPDFLEAGRRELAEVFWDRCRHDGEPALLELVSDLPSEALKQLAVELVQEVEALPDLEQALEGAVQHVCEARRRAEEARTLAQLRRTRPDAGEAPLGTTVLKSLSAPAEVPTDVVPGDSAGAVEEIALLRELAEKSSRPDMRRGLR